MCHHRHHHTSSPPPGAMKPNTPSATTKKKRKQTSTTVSLEPARKTRTKRRKPKYLSLNLKLNPQKNPRTSRKKTKMTNKLHQHQHQQLTLFPLHPENLVEDSKDDMHEHENDDANVVARFLFDTATDSSTTLNGLLTSTTTEQESPAVSPLSLTFAYSEVQGGDHNNGLVRTAMRCKERDASEEKWVSYSEVVENKTVKEEEVMSSSCIDDRDRDHDHDHDADEGAWSMKQVQKKSFQLALKLDYQEILNAWSDKGPLYVDGETPQTVPDFHDAVVPNDAWSNVGNLWSVPEMATNDGSLNKIRDEAGGKEGWKREHREASVLRYKEKRQNRLFSKRIRYEVRKLNAEKRPRMKGRFVKRSSEV